MVYAGACTRVGGTAVVCGGCALLNVTIGPLGTVPFLLAL